MGVLELAVHDHVGLVTINRPEVLNALNVELVEELTRFFTEVEDRDDIHVVVITGKGRSFVAGADIGEMVNFSAVEAKRFSKLGNAAFLKIANGSKPVIAAVNGFALGGGCELAMCCDIRTASDKAKFGMPEVGLGITPGFGGTQRLTRIVGAAKAMELTFTSRTIDAAEAYDIGLVNHVYPAEEMMDRTMELAHSIASKAQIAVRQAKQAIQRGKQTDMGTAVAFEAEAFGLCFSTEDQKDAMRAFLSKEKMDTFKNR